MRTSMFRFMSLAAACGMLAVLLTYSSAAADTRSAGHEVAGYCTTDTLDADTGSVDESLFTSGASETEEVEPNSCYFCTTNQDCNLTPYTRDGYCGWNNCCVWY